MKKSNVEMGSASRVSGTVVTVVGIQAPQIQFYCEVDGVDGYVDLSRNECRQLAKILIEHCDEADYKNK